MKIGKPLAAVIFTFSYFHIVFILPYFYKVYFLHETKRLLCQNY